MNRSAELGPAVEGGDSERSAPPRWGRAWLPAALLFIVTTAVFSGALANDFVDYDDPRYVLENPIVNRGLDLDAVRDAFGASHMGNWHPVTWLSHALDVQCFGLEPAGHHATSVLLHALSTALAFLLLLRTTGQPGAAFFTAALFGLHPLRVESVAWVSERKDVLSVLFALVTLHLWVSWVRAPRPGRYLALVATFTLGLMSKAMLVTLPILLLLVDRWPLEREAPLRRRVLEKLPLLLLAAGVSVVTVITQDAEGSVAPLGELSLLARLEQAPIAALTYLRQSVLPGGLACFYPHPGLLDAQVERNLALASGLSLGVLVILGSLAHRVRRRRPQLWFATAWFLVCLVPVLGLAQVGIAAHADRYTYLPSLGLAVGVAFSFAAAQRGRARAATALGLVACLALALGSWRQVRHWHDTVTLFERAVAVTADNFVAHTKLGKAYAERGDRARSRQHLQRAVEIQPALPERFARRGRRSLAEGRWAAAATELEAAFAYEPQRTAELVLAAQAHLRMGDAESALDRLRVAAEHGADGPALHLLLGRLALARGAAGAAAAHLRASLERDPGQTLAWNELGQACLDLGDLEGARSAFESLVRLEPRSPNARANLAVVLELLGDHPGAEQARQRARELTPGGAP